MLRLLELKETPQEVRVGPAIVEARFEDVMDGRPKVYPHGPDELTLYKCKLRVIKEHLTGCRAGNANYMPAAQPEAEVPSLGLVGGPLPEIPEFCVNTGAVA